jgi:hypothetical protein
VTRWITLSCSCLGKRELNQDFVSTGTFFLRGRRVEVIVLCDGVGGISGSDLCAKRVGEAAIRIVENYLRSRRSRRTLASIDAKALKLRLEKLSIDPAPLGSATTIAVGVLERTQRSGKSGIIALWAGDTRIHLIEKDGCNYPLTIDHHDEEGRLTSYIRNDGTLFGRLDVNFFSSAAPFILYGTTDGVHESCRLGELVSFFLYCAYHKTRSSQVFSENLARFLSKNMSDNFSAAVVYQLMRRERVKKLFDALKLEEI